MRGGGKNILKRKGMFGTITYFALTNRVGQCARALSNLGVTKGDRVVAYSPNCIDAAIYMLATVSIGAVWSSASPDFGVSGVLGNLILPRSL
jgi:acetoacetyl-CoA synthetase